MAALRIATRRMLLPQRLACRALQAASTTSPLLSSTNITPHSPAPCSIRHSSHSPLSAATASTRKKVTTQTLRNLYKKGEPITMLTAHDFPSAHVAEVAGMDVVLVGDSLAMVALGMQDTNEVVLEDMLLHCRSVARAAQPAFTGRQP